MTKQTEKKQRAISTVQRMIEREFGGRCTSFDIDCFNCRVWLCYDLLTDLQESYEQHN